MFVLITIMLIFAYWAGGKVQEKYTSFEQDNNMKFNKVYIAYLKNDPYQFLQRLYKPTKLLITDNELLILGKNRIFVFVIHMMGVSSVINIKNITSIQRNDNVIDLSYTNEAGKKMAVCLFGKDSLEIMGHLQS